MKWQIGKVIAIKDETPTVKSFTFQLPDWQPHKAGQHYDIRLTAPDGYQAQRSYSIASEPERKGEIDLTIELLEDGEVSGFFHDEVRIGDRIELRGPIGGYFFWKSSFRKPIFLIGGGSGVVPLMAMLRHRAHSARRSHATLLYSVKHPGDVIYYEELKYLSDQDSSFNLQLTFTRSAPPQWKGYQRRMDHEMLQALLGQFDEMPICYIVGPTPMVEFAASALVDLNVPPVQIRTERFGPTGA
ncbi:MAG: ferredoxin reductase [Bacteroidota bacterium]